MVYLCFVKYKNTLCEYDDRIHKGTVGGMYLYISDINDLVSLSTADTCIFLVLGDGYNVTIH